MKKLLVVLFMVLPFLLCSNKKAFAQNAKSAILIDATSGKILYEHNKDLRLPMASMTKVMSLAIIFDAIKDGKLSLTDEITASSYASHMGGSQVYLSEGETHSLDELLKCICIASANDAMVSVSEALYGSEASFVLKMNELAKKLQMENTNYTDSTGLNIENHYTTAYDMAVISSYLINNHPSVLNYTAIKEDYIRKDTTNPFWLVNTNKLIGHVNGVDGLKTGWNNASGYCMSATMKKDNTRVISVVMGYAKPTVRNQESVELLKYGISNYENHKFLSKEDIVIEYDDILYQDKIQLVLKEDLTCLIDKGDLEAYQISYDYDIKRNENNYVILSYNGNMIKKIEIIKVYGEKKNFFKLWLELLKSIFY